jgi:hypothetical protein
MNRQQYLKRLETYNNLIDNLLQETLALKYCLADKYQDLNFADKKEIQLNADEELLTLKNLYGNFARLKEEKINFLLEYGMKFKVPAGYYYEPLRDDLYTRDV